MKIENCKSEERETGLYWRERDPRRSAPPVNERLEGWEVQKSRASHINARCVEEGRSYFLKWFFHHRFRSLARAEFENARRLEALGIPTVVAVGWGVHRRGSFVVLEGSGGFQADRWRDHNVPLTELARLARELAGHAARLHDAGLCHRDLNVYHVLIDGSSLRLIDVGRVASCGRLRPRRWLVKDLASLLYSARRERIPDVIARLFLRAYLRQTRRPWRRRALLAAVSRKAERYSKHNWKKERRGLAP